VRTAWEQVKAEDVDLILQRQFGSALERLGFQPSSRRRWSRSRVPEMRDLFEVITLKGATLSPRWGFSLDLAPHVTPAGVKWHRTAKSAMFDVVDDPIDTTPVEDLELSPCSCSRRMDRPTSNGPQLHRLRRRSERQRSSGNMSTMSATS
jgi:hypothetical protein